MTSRAPIRAGDGNREEASGSNVVNRPRRRGLPHRGGRMRLYTLVVSIVAHAAILIVLVIVPLVALDALPAARGIKEFIRADAAESPEPPPPPTPAIAARAVARVDSPGAPINAPRWHRTRNADRRHCGHRRAARREQRDSRRNGAARRRRAGAAPGATARTSSRRWPHPSAAEDEVRGAQSTQLSQGPTRYKAW